MTNESWTSDPRSDVPRTDRLGGNSWQRLHRLRHASEERERERETLWPVEVLYSTPAAGGGGNNATRR